MGIIEFFMTPVGQTILSSVITCILGNVTAKHIPANLPIIGKTKKVLREGVAIIDILEQPNKEIKAIAIAAKLNDFAKFIDEEK